MPDRDRTSRWRCRAGATVVASVVLLSAACSAPSQPTPSASAATSQAPSSPTPAGTSTDPSADSSNVASNSAATNQVATSQTTTGSAPLPGEQPIGVPDLADKQQSAVDSVNKVVVDVRIGLHDGFERVVFETSGSGQAGWFAGLTNEPRQPGSGFPVEYQGQTALQIAVTGVRYPWDADAAEFTGEVAGHGGVITGISNQRTYEGQHQFTIGLARPVPYSITWLDDPGRVVVDFKTS